MKVLFAGMGSVGQRHLKNLSYILDGRLTAMAYRTTNHDHVIVDGVISEGKSLKKTYGLKIFYDLDEALAQHPEAVFITNPSALHIPAALKAAGAGAHIFLEKPISHNLDGVDELEDLIKKKDLKLMVGYQTRFHPGYRQAKQILNERTYGKVVSAEFRWETYLPDHHPYEDYRQGYAAKKDLGGGVVLGLIHDLDLIWSFFGQPDQIRDARKSTVLDMDVEDTVTAKLEFQNFTAGLFLSYAQKKERRCFRITFEQARLECDFQNGIFCVLDHAGNVISNEEYRDFKRNDLFVNELKEFLSAIKEDRQPVISFQDGKESLILALRIKEASGG